MFTAFNTPLFTETYISALKFLSKAYAQSRKPIVLYLHLLPLTKDYKKKVSKATKNS